MILQIHRSLPRTIQQNGCYLMSLIYAKIATQRDCRGVDWEDSVLPADVIKIYRKSVRKRAMEEDCFILNADLVLDIIGSVLDISTRVFFSGVHSQRYLKREREIIIGKWVWKFGHFVVMDGTGKEPRHVSYDPLGESSSVRRGNLESTRIYKYCIEDDLLVFRSK